MATPRALLAGITATFPLAGVIGAAAPPAAEPALAIVHGLVVGVLIYTWCRAESLRRYRAPPGRSALLAGVFPLIGLPLYFFRTRRWQVAGRDTARAGALALVLLLVQFACAEFAGFLLP